MPTFNFSVDSSGSIRVRKEALAKAGLNEQTAIQVRANDGTLVLSAVPSRQQKNVSSANVRVESDGRARISRATIKQVAPLRSAWERNNAVSATVSRGKIVISL
jgi:hypothetical protein